MNTSTPPPLPLLCSLLDLPEPIIHHVMSYLPPYEAASMILLSSRFASLYYSFPFIELRYNSYRGRFNEFLNYVNDIYLARRAPDVALEKFLFHVDAKEGCAHDRIDRVIYYALDNKVKDLDLLFEGPIYDLIEWRYTAPLELLSAKSLKVLSLSGCSFAEDSAIISSPLLEKLSITRSSLKFLNVLSEKLVSFTLKQSEVVSCPINILRCKLLKHMILRNVIVGNEWIGSVVSTCSQLETLHFGLCFFSGNLFLQHDRLKVLKVWNCGHLTKIDVRAVNLENFHYQERADQLCEISLVGSKFLKTLSLSSAKRVTDEWLRTVIPRLKFLETLRLWGCKNITEVKIRNHNLKMLLLVACDELRNIEIIARNLNSFCYEGETYNLESVVFDSIGLNAEIMLPYYSSVRSLRFLSCFGHCTHLKLFEFQELLIVPKSLREVLVSPMYDLKKLEVDVYCSSYLKNLEKLVDSCLWLAPNLDELIIASVFSKKSIIKFRYAKTIERKKDENLCCHMKTVKCWRDFLTEVTLTNFNAAEKEIMHHYFITEIQKLRRQIQILCTD